MSKPYDPLEVKKISCDVCRKEVPLSAAVTPEGADYVAHFCGLECYSQWKRDKTAGKQRGKAVK